MDGFDVVTDGQKKKNGSTLVLVSLLLDGTEKTFSKRLLSCVYACLGKRQSYSTNSLKGHY